MNAFSVLVSFAFFIPMALAIGGQLLADETGDAVLLPRGAAVRK